MNKRTARIYALVRVIEDILLIDEPSIEEGLRLDGENFDDASVKLVHEAIREIRFSLESQWSRLVVRSDRPVPPRLAKPDKDLDTQV